MQWLREGELHNGCWSGLYMKTRVVIPTVGRTFFALNKVMALSAGGRTSDEIIVIDQTTPEDRNPIAFAALKGHERRGLCRVIEYSVKSATIARNVAVLSSDADLDFRFGADGWALQHAVIIAY
jgi:hypothetical protein